MTNKFDEVRALYEDLHREHGDSPAALMTPKGRNEIRFLSVLPLLTRPKMRILDYGCGLGYLYDFLAKNGQDVEYTGVDITPSFIESCRKAYPDGSFELISPEAELEGRFDIVFSSGVFNIATHENEELSKAYAFDRIRHLFDLASEALVCDCMSGYVDFQQEGALHFSVSELSDFCVANLGRRFVIRHDLLPYETTVIAYKNSDIRRPDNVFEGVL